MLAVRENTNTGWQATLGGQTLKPLVVDGWQQGWILPAGASGEVVLRFAPDTTYRAGLLLGGILLAVVVVLAVLPARQPSGRTSAGAVPRGRRRLTRSLPLLAVGAAALVLWSGLIGGLVVAAGFMLAVPGPRRLPGRSTPSGQDGQPGRRDLASGAFILLAGWLYLDSPHRNTDALLQLMIVVALSALWLSTTARRRPVRRVPPTVATPAVPVVVAGPTSDTADQTTPETAGAPGPADGQQPTFSEIT
ncbi:hypothetical protein NKG94_37305 [Micromonospora sp. M12]